MNVPYRMPPAPPLVPDLATAVAREIGRHRNARLLCRLGFHDPAPWFVEFFGTVEVRRCYRCGCAMDVRDTQRTTTQ